MTNTEKPITLAEQKKEVVNTPKVNKQEIKTPLPKKVEEKKEDKKPAQTKPKVKKTQAEVNVLSIHASTKVSTAICKFIKNKKISKAISDLEQVMVLKKAVPMKGEIPHRKGKRMMSGRFPARAAEKFVGLLKSLMANANVNEIENPVVVEAIANMGSRPFGKFGRVKRKRTHVKIVAKDKKTIKKINKKQKAKKPTRRPKK